MTIAAGQTGTFVRLPCNGVSTTFNFLNKIFAAGDLVVNLISPSGVLFPFVSQANIGLGLSYIVNNVDTDTGCSITMSSAPTNGWSIDIRSLVPEEQTTSISNQGSFLPNLHEEFFDRATRMIQDVYRQGVMFGLRAPDIETTPWPAMPQAATRANTLVGFNSSGLPTTVSISPNLGTGNAQIYGGIDSGAVNAILLTPAPALTSYSDGLWTWFFPANTNSGATTVNISGVGVVPIVNPDGSALVANQLIANQPAWMAYKGGRFLLPALLAVSPLLHAAGLDVTGAGVPANGWFLSAANTLGWATNGVQRGTISPTGDILAPGVAVCRFKAAATSRPTQTVPTNDPDLTYAIPSAGTYEVELYVNCGASGAGNGGISLNMNYSAAMTGYFATTTKFAGTAATQNQNFSGGPGIVTQSAAAMSNGSPNTNTAADFITAKGTIICTAPGTIALAWGQNTSNAAATWIDKGSFIKITKLSP